MKLTYQEYEIYCYANSIRNSFVYFHLKLNIEGWVTINYCFN